MYGKNKKLRRASKCRMLLFFQILAMTFFPMYFGKAGDFRTQFGNNSVMPVEKVAILDRDGKHIRNYKLGPFNEGESISISCVATGGEPPPLVSWWLENTLLNNVSTLILSNRRVENSLRLDPLRRSHLNRVFTCRASNSALIPPISSAVKLLINCEYYF